MTQTKSRIITPVLDTIESMMKAHTFKGSTDKVFRKIKTYFRIQKRKVTDGNFPCVFMYAETGDLDDYATGQGNRQWPIVVHLEILFRNFHESEKENIPNVYIEEMDRMLQIDPKLIGIVGDAYAGEASLIRAEVTRWNHSFSKGAGARGHIFDTLEFDMLVSVIPHELDL